MNPTILDHAFQHPTDGWYQIEALGRHPHRAANLVQVIDDEAARSIVHHFNADASFGRLRHGSEMLIDHEHFSDQPDQETRAYGWLQELQHRADGIYGRIRWTKTGKEAVDGGDYRFFSTEYDPKDLVKAESEKRESENNHVRPLRLAGLTLTNMNNNRGQKPITNRDGAGVQALACSPGNTLKRELQQTFADGQAELWPGASADTKQTNSDGHPPSLRFGAAGTPTPHNKGTTMKSVCTLLGLSADADEIAVHAAVTKLLNRGDIAPDALAALRAGHQSLAEQNQNLLSEQSETLLDGCGVKDERVRNRLKDGMKPLKNRQERLSYLADFGYQPGEPAKFTPATRVLNRGTAVARESAAGNVGEGDQAVAAKIQNRANELQGKGMKYDTAWNQARKEVLGKN